MLNKRYTVNIDNSEIRIDRWLRKKFILSQSFLQKNLRKGQIKLNGKIVKANTILKIDDEIEILNFNDKRYVEKTNLKIDIQSKYLINKFKSSIMFENSDYLIINKWKGISTQGGTKIYNSIPST